VSRFWRVVMGVCAVLPFISWLRLFCFDAGYIIYGLPRGQDSDKLADAWWATAGILLLLTVALVLAVSLKRRPPKSTVRQEELDAAQSIVVRTSGLRQWCGRPEAMVLGSCHIALVLADACEEMAERIHRSIESLSDEWHVTKVLGSEELTEVMRCLASRKESACRKRAQNLLYDLAPFHPGISVFLEQARQLCDDLTAKTVTALDDKLLTHREKQERVRADLAGLLDRAAHLRTDARKIAANLKITTATHQEAMTCACYDDAKGVVPSVGTS